jgi:two-component system sensor histidine kinase CpxA
MTRTVGQLTQATAQIAQGRFDVRVDSSRRDELGALSLSINQMAARLAGLVDGQKRFLGDIAHELCSPLARLQVALGILEQRAGDADREYISRACRKAEELAALVNELLSFSKASLAPDKVELKLVLLDEVVEKAINREADDSRTVVANVPAGLLVRGDTELLVRAVSNLVRNAIRYAGRSGPIEVAAHAQGEEVVLTVADSGPGIPEQHLDKIFDPFFRLDPSRDRNTGGAGLGLTIVKTCVESCGGQITCQNRAPRGLQVAIRLIAARPRQDQAIFPGPTTGSK